MRLNSQRLLVAARNYSKNKSETDFLADALGLLSPKKSNRNVPSYKPLILRNLQRGPVTEHYSEIEKELLPQYNMHAVDHSNQLHNLILDLHVANELPSKRPLQKNLMNHVRSLQNEDELVDLAKLSFYQNRLTLPLMTRFILNKHLQQLSRLPFDVNNLDQSAFEKNGWSELNFSEFKILLLKKYHDLNQPLLIVRLLRDEFDHKFLPLIRQQKLSPFYERIVWKFYFDYIQMGLEKSTIKSLDNVRTSFLIWEASTANCCEIAGSILHQHELNKLQRLFFELCSCNAVESIISTQLEAGTSPFLSALKKISVKFKLYNVDDSLSENVTKRALTYSFIHSVEDVISTYLPEWRNDAALARIMSELRSYRSQMVREGVSEHIGSEVYAN